MHIKKKKFTHNSSGSAPIILSVPAKQLLLRISLCYIARPDIMRQALIKTTPCLRKHSRESLMLMSSAYKVISKS